MKKLLHFVLALGLTFSASAGAVSWNAMNIKSSSGSYETGVTTYSAYLYIVTGSVTYDTIIGYLNAGKVSQALAAASDWNTGVAMTASRLDFAAKDYGSFKNETVQGFMIITDGASMNDADNYLVALNEATAILSVDFGDHGDLPFAWGNQGSNTAWQEIGAVPEPASMSLLLVGLAGIGLRRKLKKAKKAA